MKAIFDTKPGSRYDDEAAVRYHFPNGPYLGIASQCVGDWIIYREPRDSGGSMAYFGAARVVDIVPDHSDPTHSYALMSDYIPFSEQVPFRINGRYEERRLRSASDQSKVGTLLRGRSVRPLDDDDFVEIVFKGMAAPLSVENAKRLELDPALVAGIRHAFLASDLEEKVRVIEQVLVNRPIREAGFRHDVLLAYKNTCAVTGMCIVNGGGKAEAQAAHIMPVADGGPDIVQNGIALCGTAHWLFDRHLISIGEDWRLLIAHNRLPENVRSSLFSPLGEIMLPDDQRLWPGTKFLNFHRERFAQAAL